MSNTIDLGLSLDQRGRASVDFIGMLGQANNRLRENFSNTISQALGDDEALPEGLEERANLIEPIMADHAYFQTQQLLGEYHARYHGPIATEAFERVQSRITLEVPGAAQLYPDPDFTAPPYWQGVDFHRTAGGWDGHVNAGYIHAEIVHRKMVEKIFPGGIFALRRMAAEKAPKDQYESILDMGCSTGHYTQALADAYPTAKIIGIDPSIRALEHCQRVANARGDSWSLHQGLAEKTPFSDNSFDLVTSYILLHEVPRAVAEAIFAEAFRVLRPGADLLMADVTRFADMSRLLAWRQDLIARMGGEPFWRESAQLDLVAIAEAAGFEGVTGSGKFPYIVQGTKPND